MDIAFDAIGIEVSNKTAFENLARDVGRRGEISLLQRRSGVLHGRCLKLGAGLEIWNVLFESGSGRVCSTAFRPGFRARYTHEIAPWILTEFDESGEAVIHGFLADSETEVLFRLQNLTELGSEVLEQHELHVGLCGLAARAVVTHPTGEFRPKRFVGTALGVIGKDHMKRICGRVLEYRSLRNPISGSDLYWIHIETGLLDLEVLASRRGLRGNALQIGSFIEAEVWLQGHIFARPNPRRAYEGVDPSFRTVDFWRLFKRLN